MLKAPKIVLILIVLGQVMFGLINHRLFYPYPDTIGWDIGESLGSVILLAWGFRLLSSQSERRDPGLESMNLWGYYLVALNLLGSVSAVLAAALRRRIFEGPRAGTLSIYLNIAFFVQGVSFFLACLVGAVYAYKFFINLRKYKEAHAPGSNWPSRIFLAAYYWWAPLFVILQVATGFDVRSLN